MNKSPNSINTQTKIILHLCLVLRSTNNYKFHLCASIQTSHFSLWIISSSSSSSLSSFYIGRCPLCNSACLFYVLCMWTLARVTKMSDLMIHMIVNVVIMCQSVVGAPTITDGCSVKSDIFSYKQQSHYGSIFNTF